MKNSIGYKSVEKFVEICIINLTNSTPFYGFLYQFLCYPKISKGKISFFFEIMSPAFHRSVISTLRLMSKRPISFDFPRFQNSHFSKNAGLIFESRSQFDTFNWEWTVSSEKYRFCSSHQNRDNRKSIQRVIYKDFYWYSNTYFSTNIGFICSMKVPSTNMTLVEDDSIGKPFFDPSIVIPTVTMFKQCWLLLICFENQTQSSK